MKPVVAGRVAVPGIAPWVVGVVAALGVAATLVAFAPANWLAEAIATRTHGVVLLADADGTVWSGSAVLGLASPRDGSVEAAEAAGPVDAAGAGASRLALPGRVTWTLEITRTLAPVLHLKHDGVLLQPVAVRVLDGVLALDDGTLALPATILRLAGAPLNTLLPDGRALLAWRGLRFDRQGWPSGEGTLRIADFSLALSPVRPLGDYLVSWASGPAGLTWRLATERGPLELEGNGSGVGRRGQVRVVVRVARDAPAVTVPQLNMLLDLIGRRGPGEAVIESGGR